MIYKWPCDFCSHNLFWADEEYAVRPAFKHTFVACSMKYNKSTSTIIMLSNDDIIK